MNATPDGERRRTSRCHDDVRPHTGQRLDHPFHRPSRQRGITGQQAVECLSSQQAGHQTHGCAGVPQVERLCRSCETPQTDTLDANPSLVGTFDLDPHRLESRERRQAVLTLQETGDIGDIAGQRTQHDRAV